MRAFLLLFFFVLFCFGLVVVGQTCWVRCIACRKLGDDVGKYSRAWHAGGLGVRWLMFRDALFFHKPTVENHACHAQSNTQCETLTHKLNIPTKPATHNPPRFFPGCFVLLVFFFLFFVWVSRAFVCSLFVLLFFFCFFFCFSNSHRQRHTHTHTHTHTIVPITLSPSAPPHPTDQIQTDPQPNQTSQPTPPSHARTAKTNPTPRHPHTHTRNHQVSRGSFFFSFFFSSALNHR